ncbi:MAG: DNA polymerase III subunit beta [Deferrisomatales bacterium]|nr:DNA polymerase III subunit beta [Deferrisomatales bacterium]
MKIQVGQESFASLLSLSQSVLERKSTRPILENILLEAVGDSVRVSATDLRVSIVQRGPCEVSRPGAIAIPGRKLHEILREMPKGSVDIEVMENGWITVSAGKIVFHLPGTDPQEYPSIPPPPSAFVSADARTFREMLDKTLFAASNDESRLYLCGVYTKAWTDDDGRSLLRMVATDGHRLSLIDRPLPSALGPFADGVILPKKGLSELKVVLEDVEGNFELTAHEGRVHARVGATDISLTLVEGTFPNYQQVIPAEAPHGLRVDRSVLIDALRRVSLLSDQESRSVVLEAQGGLAVLSSADVRLGEARDEIEVEYEGAPLKIAFNAAYVLEALRALGGTAVTLSILDSLSPCLLRSNDDPRSLCVVMPMRVD